MGALTKAGWQRMDVLVSEHGADDVLHMVCDQVANGISLTEIGRSEGIPYTVLWKWLKGEDSRFKAYSDALMARADSEAHRLLELADSASPEDVNVVKLRTDVRKWLAGKWDRDRYGDKQSIEVTRVDLSMKDLLEVREKRLLEIVPIEGQSERVDDDKSNDEELVI